MMTLRYKNKSGPPQNTIPSYWKLFAKSLLAPVLVLLFFAVAPHWFNSKLRSALIDKIHASPNLSAYEKTQRAVVFAKMDFEGVCRGNAPQLEKLREGLQKDGIDKTFQRLRWGFCLSVILAGVLGTTIGAILLLNQRAKRSLDDLISGYRISWKIAMAATLTETLLLIPLLAYGTFEFTVLLCNSFFPKLLLVIVIGGVILLWRSVAILLKKVPLEFKEPISREVTPEEAPELWEIVRKAACRLQTDPPTHIIVGMQLNFYVTELAVWTDQGRVEGRTLFLSYPLMKQLSEPEIVSIIGHELGHFVGRDTRMTREFYPLRLKVQATMMALARSLWVGWTSLQFLNFFSLRFAETIQEASRTRELLADQKGAALTSPETAACALVKFQVILEAFQRGLSDTVHQQRESIFDGRLRAIVREKLIPEAVFWTQLFEKKQPHPLDSHPALNIRLEALGQTMSVDQAQAIAVEELDTAFAKWFSNRSDLFADLTRQIDGRIDQMRAGAQVVNADYTTEAGKELLDRHFPEQTWRKRGASLWIALILLGFIIFLSALAFIYINVPTARIFFGVLAAIFCYAGVVVWKRHHHATLSLNAERIEYSGWKHPIYFQQIQTISAMRQYSNVTLIFRLKAPQRTVWKLSPVWFSRKVVSFSLSGLDAHPIKVAETIFRYFKRQINP